MTLFLPDSKTMLPVEDLAYDWEYYLSLGDNLPDVPDVMDSERVDSFKEGPNGFLTLVGKDARVVNREKVTRVRCRVTKEGVDYTSPYFDIRLENEDVPIVKPGMRPC